MPCTKRTNLEMLIIRQLRESIRIPIRVPLLPVRRRDVILRIGWRIVRVLFAFVTPGDAFLGEGVRGAFA